MKSIEADILIVGAGAAGIAATISATQGNSKVVLIEKNEFLGGKATASSVGTICGLYLRSDSDIQEHIHGGFVKDFAQELESISESKPLKNQFGLKYLPYKIDAFKELGEEKIKRSGALFLKNTSIKRIQLAGSCISEIECMGPEGEMRISVKQIIDCSGHAIVSELANQPIITDEKLQSAAFIFEIDGMQNTSETNINYSIKRCALKVKDSELKNYLLGTSVVPGSLSKDKIMLKMGIPESLSTTAHVNEAISSKSRGMIEALFIHLKKSIPLFKAASIHHISKEMGERTGKRPLGKYVLTKEDVISCKKFQDGIARGAWPIEKWSKGHQVEMQYFDKNNFYHIPIDCLISQNIDNLSFAGRSISAEEDAIASARVIGTCLATGYASGVLASERLNQESQANIIDKIQAEIFIDIPATT